MTPLERFQHLLAMAAADERMNEAELGFLSERAFELGITQDQFHDAMQIAVTSKAEIAIPKGAADRRALLKDLLLMMAADGNLDKREQDLFGHVAAAMGIETDELHRVIDTLIAEQS